MPGAPECSLLIGPLKTACENTHKIVSPDGKSSSGLPNILNPSDWSVGFGGDLAHFAMRIAEFGIGIGLILIALNALVKGSAVTIPSTVKLARKVGK
jgi:hypothetical protein